MHTYNTVLEATLVANFKVECQFCELKDEIQKLAAQVNSMLEGTKFSFGSLEFGFSKAASVEIVQVFRNGDEGKTYVFPLQDHRYPIFKAKRDSLNQFDVRMRVEYQTEAEIQAKSYSAAVGAFEKLCNIG